MTLRPDSLVPLPAAERDLELLLAACGALLAGEQIRADSLAAELARDLPRRAARPAIPYALQAEVLRRDQFSCRYCGTRTVPACVLRAAALTWPDYLPYHPNWRVDSTHPIFAARAATFDHVRPHAHGGDNSSAENVVTACRRCNVQKSDFSLDSLGWILREPDVSSDWDGLTHAYRALWERARHHATESQVRYHTRWLHLLAGRVSPG